MPTIQLSMRKMKSHVQALHTLAADPMATLRGLGADLRGTFEQLVNALLEAELTVTLGRERYEQPADDNHRNGARPRRVTLKGLEPVALRIPRDRTGRFQTRLVPERVQYDPELEADLQLLFLGGASTRTVELMSERLFGRRFSAAEVSAATQKVTAMVEAWRRRSLAGERYVYLFVDGTNFAMRRGDTVVQQCVLVVLGITEQRQRRVLALQAGDKESASAWRAVFAELVERGFDPTTVQLGVMDGLPGLESVFRAVCRHAAVQRCQVHKARNVLVKVRLTDRRPVAADLRGIFYAPDRATAKQHVAHFHDRWGRIYPDAVACLEKDLEAILAYPAFPADEWVSLRTTNPIERLNKEFKRRTKPMEIVAGEASAYRILAFVAMKMEEAWRRATFRNPGSRYLKPFQEYFTHNT